MSRATFPAAARMHRPNEFAAALSGKRIARGALFILTAKIHDTTGPGAGVLSTNSTSDFDSSSKNPAPTAPSMARLGLIMAKRLAHHASTRNALKRVVRESFRIQRHQLPVGDYVVRLNKKIQDVTLTQLKFIARQEVDAHFLKARRK